MTAVIVLGAIILLWRAPSLGRPAVLGYALTVGALWWVTSGERPWVWPYAGRSEARAHLRLSYCILQLNRTAGRLLVATVALLAVLLGCALAITVVVALFDVLADWDLSLSSYTEFYTDKVLDWLEQAAAGHAGSH